VLYKTNRRSVSDRNLFFISLQLKTREELFSIAHKRFSKPVILYNRKKTLRNTIELKKLNIGYSFNYRRMRRGV
jgi:hypothetical protein